MQWIFAPRPDLTGQSIQVPAEFGSHLQRDGLPVEDQAHPGSSSSLISIPITHWPGRLTCHSENNHLH